MIPAAALGARHSAPAPLHSGRGTADQRAAGGGYDSAQRGNWDLRWTPKDESPDIELSKDLRALRERCIDLVRNDPLAYGVIDTLAHGVVGRGPRPRSLARDPQVAADLDAAWATFAPVAGWDGVTSWADVVRGVVHASCLSGDVLVLWPDVGDGTGPRVDLVDARRVDSPTDATPEVASSRLGVGYDRYGRVLGYYAASGESATQGKREGFRWFPLSRNGRINARLFKRPSVMRPRQSRAVPMFAPAALDLKDLREYRRTETRRAQTAAKINTIITTPDPKSVADAYENVSLDAGAGTEGIAELLGRSYGTTPDGSMMVLGLGETAQVVTPPQVNGGVGDYITAMLRCISSCTGLPTEEAFGLYHDLNYSNARMIKLISKVVYRDWRDDLEGGVCNPTWSVVAQYAWATGALGRVPWSADMLAVSWAWDEQEPVDFGKEVKGNTEAVTTGQRSIVDICAAQGRDAYAILQANLEYEAEEMRQREALGLPPKGAVPVTESVVEPASKPEAAPNE